MEMKLGNYEVSKAEDTPKRLSMLIWGMAGCGKTTLAATAPGEKLWINFDPDGITSIAGLKLQHEDSKLDTALKNQIHVLDLSAHPSRVVDGFKRDDHLGLGKVFADPECTIDTVVVDSLTRVSQLSIESAIASGQHGRATIEKPGQSVYGARNALTYRVISDILTVTGKYNKNVIFITHEGPAQTNEEGVMLYITMALGGQLPQLSANQISEVWIMADTGKKRRIAIRPVRGYKPVKSRMFDTTGEPEFDWDYDINNPNPKMEIATWWKEFQDGGKKIPVPKAK